MEKELIAWPDEVKRRSPGIGAYLRPWATTVGLIPAGWAAHLAWGDAGLTTGLAATGITAAGACVTWLSWRLCRARTWYAALVAPATAGGITAWMATATIAGVGRPWVDLLVVGGAALSGLINIHTWQRNQSGGRSGNTVWDRPMPTWREVCQLLGLRDVRMRVVARTDTQIRAEVTVPPGSTVDSLQGRRDELASAYDVAPGAVRVIPDPSRARRATLIITTQDVMGQLIPWPGLDPDEVGTSIADAPLTLGVYEDGTPFTDEVDNRHTLVVGMSGAGKSVYGKIKMVSVAARCDTFVMCVDLSKSSQTIGPIRRAIGWAATTRAEAHAMLAALERAVTARANYLGERGLPGWTRDCGLTLLHVQLEEAADLADLDRLVKLLRTARSTGIHFEISLQRATWSNIDTDTRAQLGDGVCFGVRDEADARFALPDYVTEAGAAPHHWRKSRPGAAYAAVESAPPERHALAVKMYGPPSTQTAEENVVLSAAAESLPDQDAKLDEVTREAFGQAYADYHLRRAGTEPQQDALVAADEHQDQEHTVTTAADHDGEPAVTYQTPDPDPDIPTPSLDDPIEMPPGGQDFAFGPAPRSRESAAEARARLDAQLNLWADQGHSRFRAPELLGALRSSGLQRSRAWLLGELKRLEAEGRLLHHDGGEYELATDREPVPA
ncbi:type IV secretory system conjugative DNA transfer family protein [Thermobifida cellulosilytica]|uniref:FtsK domain-containing protein n=1 Tax=Thermobifida cellulosilytica TB100 TaxID=665004 RepID=A0A147KM55_THECS|nr:hypothetical protein [Thermobifida cellulosilytica]KUP98392.1 hypothetical protein AC529_01700 [Thermobifida cellulosilytica TB100]